MHSRLFLNKPKVVASLYAAVWTRQPFPSLVLSLFTARVMCYYPLHHHHHHCQVVFFYRWTAPPTPLLPRCRWRKMSGRGIFFQEERVRNDDKVVWCADTTTANTTTKTCHLSSPPTSRNCSQAEQKEKKKRKCPAGGTFLFHLNKNHLIIIFHPKSQ